MKGKVLSAALTLAACVTLAAAAETPALRLVTAQSVAPNRLTVTGRVIPLLAARICARVTGNLQALGKLPGGENVEMGACVKAGQELFRVDPATFMLAVNARQAALEEAQAQLADLRAGVRSEEREALKAAIDDLDAQLEEGRLDEARYTDLIKVEGAITLKQLEAAQYNVRCLLARRAAARAHLQEAEAGPTATAVAVAQARVAQAQAALNTAQQDLADTSIKAPYDGVITRRFKGPGDFLTQMPITEVMELVSLQYLVAELRVPEAYFTRIAAGKTQAALRSPSLKEPQAAPVARVVPMVDPLQGSFAAWVALPPELAGQFTPGGFIQAELELGDSGDGVLVPQQAVVNEDGKQFVFVAENGKMRQCEVKTGDRMTEYVILKTGVSLGQKVVLGPRAALKDGAPCE